MDSRIVRLLLLAIVIVAVALRYPGLATDEPWHDEAFSVLESLGCRFDAGSPGQGFTRAELEANRTLSNTIAANQFMDSGNGALYAVSLHFWSKALGITPAMYRIFSLAWFIATMLLAFRLSKEFFGKDGSALLAAAALAITMLLVPVNIRPYQMGTALALACTLQLVQLLRSTTPGWWRVAFYAALATASVFTHFSTAYVLLAHPLVALIHRPPARNWFRLAIGGAVSISVLMLWLLTFGQPGLEMMAKHNAYYADIVKVTPDPGTFFRLTTARTLIEGLVLQGAWAMSNSLLSAGLQLRTVMVLMAIPWLLIAITYRHPAQPADRKGIASLSAFMVVALTYSTFLALLSGHTTSFMAYYATFVTPYWAILVAHATWSAFRITLRKGPLRIVLALCTWAVLVASVLNPPPEQPIAPNAYAEEAGRLDAAVERYDLCALMAIHASKTAAYLSTWHSNEAAAGLKHYVVPSYQDINGLLVACGRRAWVVPIRARNDQYKRSQPKDVETWGLTFGPVPELPDSVDGWLP